MRAGPSLAQPPSILVLLILGGRDSGAFRFGLWGGCCLLLDTSSWDHQAQAQLRVLSMTKCSSDWTSGPDLGYRLSPVCQGLVSAPQKLGHHLEGNTTTKLNTAGPQGRGLTSVATA